MKNSRLWASLIIFTTLVTALFVFTIATGRNPVLGLDLKGGLSVIYATTEPATEDDLIVVRDLMRDQLESFGIAEPDVRVEGDNIIVDLPGVSDQDEAFEALQVSGIVELRPVLQCQAAIPTDTTGSTLPGDTTGSTSPGITTAPGAQIGSSVPDADSSALGAPSASGGHVGRNRPRSVPDSTTPSTTSPPTSSPTDSTVPSSTVPTSTVPTSTPDDGSVVPQVLGPPAPTTTVPIDTSGYDSLPYPSAFQECVVGPPGGTGEVFERGSAKAVIDSQGAWAVTVDLRDDGLTAWNQLAEQCYSGGSTCPTRQLAIVLDDVIQSAPVVQQPNFPDTVSITGAFDEPDVRSLARVLNRGAFPVTVEQQRVETVSPTAGTDALQAAVIAGLIGVGLMLAFMIFYYRRLAVVIIGGLVVWSMTVFVLAAFMSNTWNYAFTIAGATGLIVSVGVTVDTYVVFFERIRDETRHGRALVNAAPRSFTASWGTIVNANFVAMLAAFVLFWLSVGSVKGFALYLGMTTVCDLVVFYFVTRPATLLLAQTSWLAHDRALRPKTAIGATS